MAHCKKFTMAACGHMFKHYERAKEKDGEYVKFGNQDIDTSKSHLNYNLAPIQHNGQGGFVKERCSEVKMQNRKDVNVMCSWAVTAPKEIREDETETFFRETYKFLSERYGRENVVSAYVHMDETTPHIHFAFVPVVTDKKKDIKKVSAKEAIDRKELQTFHKDLSGYMEKIFGRDIRILNEATVEGNKSIEELKRGTAQEQLSEVKKESAEKAQEIVESNKRIKALKTEEKALERDIKALEKILSGNQLTQEELEKIQPIKGWFGIKNITVKDIKNLKKMAMTTLEEKRAMNKVEQEIELLKEENAKLKKQVPTMAQKIEQTTKENKIIEERDHYKHLHDRIAKCLDRMPSEQWEKFTEIFNEVLAEERAARAENTKDSYEMGD